MRTSSISRSILRRSAVKPADEEDEDGSAILSENEASDNDTSFIDHDSYTSGYVSPLHSTYAYHSPTDEDYMIATPREVVPRQGAGRVRRVSRGERKLAASCVYELSEWLPSLVVGSSNE